MAWCIYCSENYLKDTGSSIYNGLSTLKCECCGLLYYQKGNRISPVVDCNSLSGYTMELNELDTAIEEIDKQLKHIYKLQEVVTLKRKNLVEEIKLLISKKGFTTGRPNNEMVMFNSEGEEFFTKEYKTLSLITLSKNNKKEE